MSDKTDVLTAPPAAKKLPYRMPHTYMGQTVLWYEGGVRSTDGAYVALVQQVNHGNIQVVIFARDSTTPRIREDVRHMDDPGTKQEDRVMSGGWDFCDEG